MTSGSRSKKIRREARKLMRKQGLTPENIMAKTTMAAWALVMESLRDKPKWIPAFLWKRLVLLVIDMDKLRNLNAEIRSVPSRETGPRDRSRPDHW